MSMYTHICKNLCALQIAFGCRLQIAFGCRLHFDYRLNLVADCIWLHTMFGYF